MKKFDERSRQTLAEVEAVLSSPKGGWLYAVVAPEVRRVKIGWARDVEARVRPFQTASPSSLALHSATLHGDVRAAEREAHKELEDAHVLGEWFDLRDPQVDQWLARRETDVPMNSLYDRYLAAKGKDPFGPPLIMGEG